MSLSVLVANLGAAVLGSATTIAVSVVKNLGKRSEIKATAETDAYNRARAIDDGANARLTAENKRLTDENARLLGVLSQEREEAAAREARLRDEIDTLEAKLRGLLDEVIALRSRIDDNDAP